MDTNHVKVCAVPTILNPGYFFQSIFSNPKKHIKLLSDNAPYNPALKKFKDMAATPLYTEILGHIKMKTHVGLILSCSYWNKWPGMYLVS